MNVIDNEILNQILEVMPSVRQIRKRGIVIGATTVSGTVMIKPDIAPYLLTYDFYVEEHQLKTF